MEPTFAGPQISREIQNMVAKLPSRVKDLIYQQKLSTDTIVILSRAADAGITSNSGAYLGQVAKRRLRRRKYNDFWEVCPCLSDLYRNSPSLDQVVTLALIVSMCASFSPAQDNTCMFQDARLTLSKVCSQYRAKGSTERECLVWSYVIAIDAWKIGSGSKLPNQGKVLREGNEAVFPRGAREDSSKNYLEKILSERFDSEQKCSVWFVV